MRTPLDDARTWYLHQVTYQGELRVVVAEGFVGSTAEHLQVGEKAIETFPIEVTEGSRYYRIRFPHYVAWQVVNECFTTFDEYEQRDDTGTLQTLHCSKYLDYVNANHGWYADLVGPAKHYRVWTENEVIDVVACMPPVIEAWVEK